MAFPIYDLRIDQRTDLVVPAGLVSGLRIPALAITDGSPDVEWVPVPLSTWSIRRNPSVLLPLDRRSARSVRRNRRFRPWTVLGLVIQLAVWLVWSVAELLPGGRLVTGLVLLAGFGWLIWLSVGMPATMPSSTRSGEVRIPAVPAAVAQEWIALNPGVRPRS